MTDMSKLTLRLDPRLIERAKKVAGSSGQSVSGMVADYFRTLESAERGGEDLPPLTRSLYGVLKGSGATEEQYRRHLEEQHG